MKGLFGFARSAKDRLSAQRFEYTITIHNLQPWPDAGNRAVAIGWQRGKKKRGATRSVYPSTQPGKIGTLARFNEKFQLTATLYKSSSGSGNPNNVGSFKDTFKKKCLILAVLETDGRTQATAALGRVVIDLAEFAAVDKQETRAFMVTCNRSIHAAVGDTIQLLITIRTCWKKSAATVGASGEVDEAGSMSTDTTGSRMTQNLSSFLRYQYTQQGPASVNNEQDLDGFDGLPGKSMRRNDMKVITEDEGDEPGEPGGQDAYYRAQAPPRLRQTGSFNTNGSAAASPSPYLNGGENGGSVRSRYGANTPTGAAAAAAVAGKMGNMSVGNGYQGSMNSPNMSDDHGAPTQVTAPRGIIVQQSSGITVDTYQHELLTAAACEITVHMAQTVALNSRRVERAAHAAARRIARTMVCLGPQQAPVFGMHVMRLVSNQLESSSSDLNSLAFWWSNMSHLRALLTHCSNPTPGQGPTYLLPAQASEQVLPQVRRLERVACDSIVSHLWEDVLLPSIINRDAGAGAAKAQSKRVQQDAAIRRWFDGLRLVRDKLASLQVVKPVGRNLSPAAGHVPFLRQQAMLHLLKRVDALLFYHLVSSPSHPADDLMADYDVNNCIWGQPGCPPPLLDDASLPFTRGLLTFGSGMSVGMLVTRLQQWATTEGGLPDTGSTSQAGGEPGAGGGAPSLLPLLRAAADLLMMPKEMLADVKMRRDVMSQALSIRSMLHILTTFKPDEYATDPISPDIVRLLQAEQTQWTGGRPALTDLSVGYTPAPDDVLLSKVNSGMEPGVDYDADSEDELVGFGSMAAPPGTTTRFRLLHELWYTGARYRGTLSIASSSKMGSQS